MSTPAVASMSGAEKFFSAVGCFLIMFFASALIGAAFGLVSAMVNVFLSHISDWHQQNINECEFFSLILQVKPCLISVFNLQSLKFIDLRRTPSLEIGMMMVFCYAPYALAEGLHLSGMNSFIFATNFTTNFQSHSLHLATNISTNLPKSFTWITKNKFHEYFSFDRYNVDPVLWSRHVTLHTFKPFSSVTDHCTATISNDIFYCR